MPDNYYKSKTKMLLSGYKNGDGVRFLGVAKFKIKDKKIKR
jgi:hypothetical protein